MHILKSKRGTYQIRIELLIRGGKGAFIRKVIRIGKGYLSESNMDMCQSKRGTYQKLRKRKVLLATERGHL